MTPKLDRISRLITRSRLLRNVSLLRNLSDACPALQTRNTIIRFVVKIKKTIEWLFILSIIVIFIIE